MTEPIRWVKDFLSAIGAEPMSASGISGRCLHSPLGWLTLRARDGCITGLEWGQSAARGAADPVLDTAAMQLEDYLAGRRQVFDLPLAPTGSEIVRRCCRAMQAIPFGETRTYGDLARELGVPAQVIGQACGANPIPILIPCHRVLGAAGLGGFSGRGGVETKVWLLRHEGAASLLI